MMRSLEMAIAMRYLRARRGSRLLSFISLIAIGGVVVGVSALIVVMAVMNGLQRDLREKILIGSPDLRLLTFGTEMSMPDWQPTLDRVKRTEGVVAVAPWVHTKGLVRSGPNLPDMAFISGIQPQGRGVAEVTAIRHHAVQGDFRFASSDGLTRGVVVGDLLAARLGVVLGDSLTLMTASPKDISASTGQVIPLTMDFQVTGIFQTGMYEYDDNYVFIAIDAARELARLGDAVTGLEVRTSNRWVASDVGARLEQELGYPYRAVDWQEQNSSLFQALKLEKLGMGFILGLIILVAAFNIVSNLTMVVADKTREIGILKAMGMRSASIKQIFFLQGLTIGLVGTALGVALGLVVSTLIGARKLIPLDPQIYFIDHLPAFNEVSDVLLTIAASILIAALATVYPAKLAAGLYPLEAIRHE
ncbi:MAG TPA: ABC transporter permease [Gemmatimonadaceae bacterium]